MKTKQKIRKIYRNGNKPGISIELPIHLISGHRHRPSPASLNPLFRLAHHVQSHFLFPRFTGGRK